jgi:hypothetical protein
MRTETKLGLVATYLLLSACGTGDELSPDGGAGGASGGAGTGGAPRGGSRNSGGQIYAIMPLGGAVSTGGIRNTGGEQIYPIMPMNTGGTSTGGAKNTGGQILAIMPIPVMPVSNGVPARTDSEAGSARGVAPGDDDWWQAAEAALRST